MSVAINTIDYWAGSPAWLGSYRYPGYWIRGRGFGTKPGIVTINGEAQRVISWEPGRILIAKPDRDPFWNPARAPEVMVEVTTAQHCGLAANDGYYVLAA